jgi:hypothetical protein
VLPPASTRCGHANELELCKKHMCTSCDMQHNIYIIYVAVHTANHCSESLSARREKTKTVYISAAIGSPMSAAVWVMPSDGRASYQNCTHAEPLHDDIRTGELFPLLPPFPFLLPSSITSIPEAAIAPFATIAGLQRLQLLSTVGLLKNYHARNNASPPKHSASIMASAAPDYSAPAVPAA